MQQDNATITKALRDHSMTTTVDWVCTESESDSRTRSRIQLDSDPTGFDYKRIRSNRIRIPLDPDSIESEPQGFGFGRTRYHRQWWNLLENSSEHDHCFCIVDPNSSKYYLWAENHYLYMRTRRASSHRVYSLSRAKVEPAICFRI